MTAVAWCTRKGVQLYCFCPLEGCGSIHLHGAGAGSWDESVKPLLGNRLSHCRDRSWDEYELKMITNKMLKEMHLKKGDCMKCTNPYSNPKEMEQCANWLAEHYGTCDGCKYYETYQNDEKTKGVDVK